MNFDREWTPFALEAENETFGMGRIAKAHNELRAKNGESEARVTDYDRRLSAVIPPDYKDWHKNTKSEWPEIAAATITGLRGAKEFFCQAFIKADHDRELLEARVAELQMALRLAILGKPVRNADELLTTQGKGGEHESR